MVCGLLDIHLYTQNPDALPLLKALTDVAQKQLSQTRRLASAEGPQASAGKCLEWYTLSENLYRAYLATGDSHYKDFGDVWRYDAYCSNFLNSAAPEPLLAHAFSHVNSFSSAVLTYRVTNRATSDLRAGGQESWSVRVSLGGHHGRPIGKDDRTRRRSWIR